MKASQFNFFFPYEGKIVGFNSFSQQFIVLDQLLKDLYDAAIQEGFNELKDIHIELYQTLEKLGFIVPLQEDELQKVFDLRQEVDYDDTRYHMIINPTMNCNFKCWYCYESHIKNSRVNSENFARIQQAIKSVVNSNQKLEHFHLSWFGGEPLLYFDSIVKPISDYAKTQCSKIGLENSVSFTTNGYLVNDNFIQWGKEAGIDHLQITLDGHKERHDNVRSVNQSKGSYDKIVSNIKSLVKEQIHVVVRFNYDDKNLSDGYLILEDFLDLSESDKNHIEFSFHNVWQIKDSQTEKCEDLLTHFRSNRFLADSGLSTADTVRHSCYADKMNHVTINYNGELFKCTARDFKKGSGEGILTDNGIKWNEKYQRRLDSKFKNKPCLKCPILPICNGGCSQQALEHLDDYCIWEDSGVEKKDIVFSRFKKMVEEREYFSS